MVASSVAVKRHISDSDGEFADEISGTTTDSLYSPSCHDDTQCFSVARKKRRGLIEKRRRDRINRSLNELKNIIPTANERQAAAKLEKSEVLSLAVEHIKALQMKESSSPHAVAMDYRSIGYRECINEIITYLVNIEGLGPSDPLHNRLVSHLHQQAAVAEQSHNFYYNMTAPVAAPTSAPTSPTCYQPAPSICKPEPPSPQYISQTESPDSYCYRYNNCNPNFSYEQFNGDFSTIPMQPRTVQQGPMQCYFTPQSSWV